MSRQNESLLGIGGTENCDYCWAGHIDNPVYDGSAVKRCGHCGYATDTAQNQPEMQEDN
jgi:hypothetical protein